MTTKIRGPRLLGERYSETPLPDGLLGEFAQALAAKRKQQGVSIDRLAVITGLARSSIIRYEHGEMAPTIGAVTTLAKGLGTSAESLLSQCPSWTNRPPQGD